MVFETFDLGYIIINILINELFYSQTKIENMKEEAYQNRAKIEKYDGQPFGLSNHFPGSCNADAIIHQGN